MNMSVASRNSTANITASSGPTDGYERGGIPDTVKTATDIAILITVVLMMVALGCIVEVEELKKQLRRPFGIGIALICQFILNPLMSFALAHAFQFESRYALGLLIISTCPGGSVSNLITYYIEGNVALSISMTAVSTAVAIGMMPLNLWIYSRSWKSNNMVVPYVNILFALACVVVPVPVGMLILRKAPRIARIFAKVGTLGGAIGVAISITFIIIGNPRIFHATWKAWICVFLLLSFNISFGYIAAFLLKRSQPVCRAVAIETAVQNAALAIGVIYLSFSNWDVLTIVKGPFLQGVLSKFVCFISVVCYQVWKHCCKRKEASQQRVTGDDVQVTREFLTRSY